MKSIEWFREFLFWFGIEFRVPFFWLQRHLFEIVAERFRQKVRKLIHNRSKKNLNLQKTFLQSQRKDYIEILIDALLENNNLDVEKIKEDKFDISRSRIEKKMTINVNQKC